MEVIGVVDDVRTQSLTATSEVEFYRPVLQRQRPSMQMVVRTATDAAAFESTARRVLSSIDSTLPLIAPSTLQQFAEQSLAQQRLLFVILGVFAVIAVALSTVGIYGVVASFVGQRTPEIGVRIALGAARRDVLFLIIRQGMTLAMVGLGIGLLFAFGVAQLLAKLLFGVSPADPLTFVGVSLLLALVAALACYVPARRATRVDPLVALRYE